MNGIKQLSALVAALLQAGCGGGNGIQNIDKPAPYEYESWVKPGTTLLDVKKALLECGKPSTSPNAFIYEKALGIRDSDGRLNHQFLSDACMEKAGFSIRWGDTVAKYCSWDRHNHLPVCQPGAVIPERSVERRLNSWHCKLKTDREYCRKHAFTPSACDDPKKDYSNPPPECRP